MTRFGRRAAHVGASIAVGAALVIVASSAEPTSPSLVGAGLSLGRAARMEPGSALHPGIPDAPRPTPADPGSRQPTPAPSPFTDPHGGYSSATDLCRTCHGVHVASDPRLLVAATERQTCYACHDGTGAGTDVRSDFGEEVIGSSTKAGFHPVPSPKNGVRLVCSDCHTPHRLLSEDTKLLRVKIGEAYVYSPPTSPIGNQFCYSCHGSGSALPAPWGDHSGFESSVHNTDGRVPLPASGSEIKCLACHAPHGSDFRRLTQGDEEALCLDCHTQADPKTSGGTNPAYAFTAAANDYETADGTPVRVFHHPIATTEQAGGSRVVECVSCHNPHLADDADTATGSKIVDPGDTSSEWIVTWDPSSAGLTRGNIGDWCVTCHVAPGVTEPVPPRPTVPYPVRLVNDDADDADGRPHDGFEASEYASDSPHGPGEEDLACTACHDFHGSSNAYLLREDVVSPDGSRTATVVGFEALPSDWPKLQTLCFTCHPDQDPGHGNEQLCTRCHRHGTGRL